MYGENTGQLRTELADLLRQHRIQQRLGGKGLHSVPETTTIKQREALGQQIARYRHGALVWCLQATRAATPHISLERPSGRTRDPSGELRHRLTAAIEASSAQLPTIDELTTPQEFSMVESWRMVARAASLAEHDLGSHDGSGYLSHTQRRTVLKDAAEITRGLVGLDRRYKLIPGWVMLKDPGRLGHAAEACATFAGHREQDHSVDHSGWRPPAVIDQAEPKQGIAGIVQGEHNLLVQLRQFPEAHSLRLVLDSQRIVSHEIAEKVRHHDPAFADRCEKRADTFKTLAQETRNVRGLLGNGGPAAMHGAIVAARAQRLKVDGLTDRTSMRQLGQVFDHIDARLTDVIEHGANQRVYFLRVKLPHLADQSEGLIHPPHACYVPINGPIQNQLIPFVRSRLRPLPEPPRVPEEAGSSRAAFQAAITHRPPPRGVTPDVPSL